MIGNEYGLFYYERCVGCLYNMIYSILYMKSIVCKFVMDNIIIVIILFLYKSILF